MLLIRIEKISFLLIIIIFFVLKNTIKEIYRYHDRNNKDGKQYAKAKDVAEASIAFLFELCAALSAYYFG